MSRLRIAMVLALAWSGAASAQAPALRTVHLVPPACGELPFAPSRLRELLALELEIDGVVLVEDPALAEAEVSYEPDPCGPGSTRFVFHLTRGGALHMHDADVGAVPLATVPRALALELAEALRGSDRARDERVRIEEPPPPPPRPEPPEAEVPLEPAPAPSNGPPTRIGVAGSIRNAPDAGGTLAGAFAFLDLPLGHDLPLLLRIDAGAAFGTSAYDLVLGSITGGVALSIWARAIDRLAVRFGPRLWLGYGWAFDAGATRQSEPLSVGAGIVAAGELALSDALALLVEAEVGTSFVGIDYAVSMGRSGFVGAYWGGQLALAWRL